MCKLGYDGLSSDFNNANCQGENKRTARDK